MSPKTIPSYKRCELVFLQSAVSLTGAAIPTTGLLFLSSWIWNSPLKKKISEAETRKPKEEQGLRWRKDGPWGRREWREKRWKETDRVSERVGGKQEEGDHSEGKEEDREIIRDGYAFAQERERERDRKEGEREQETVGDCPHSCTPRWELLSSTVPLPISHADEPQPPWRSCGDWRCQLQAGSPLNILTREWEVWALNRHVPPSLIHFNYKGLVFLQGKAVSCDPL